MPQLNCSHLLLNPPWADPKEDPEVECGLASLRTRIDPIGPIGLAKIDSIGLAEIEVNAKKSTAKRILSTKILELKINTTNILIIENY